MDAVGRRGHAGHAGLAPIGAVPHGPLVADFEHALLHHEVFPILGGSEDRIVLAVLPADAVGGAGQVDMAVAVGVVHPVARLAVELVDADVAEEVLPVALLRPDGIALVSLPADSVVREGEAQLYGGVARRVGRLVVEVEPPGYGDRRGDDEPLRLPRARNRAHQRVRRVTQHLDPAEERLLPLVGWSLRLLGVSQRATGRYGEAADRE